MDEDCKNCRRCKTRSTVVHGYGDVAADFLFVVEAPSASADATGRPLSDGAELSRILETVGFLDRNPAEREADSDGPVLRNAYVTHLVRCHVPDDADREPAPTDEEIAACDPFLTAEIRMINPHVIVPIGQSTLAALAVEYTTSSPDAFDVREAHATTVRGRGFELVPMLEPDRQSDAEREAWERHLVEDVLGRDYRQTKGRQER